MIYLKDIIENLKSLNEDATIFATKPFNKESKVKILNEIVEDIEIFIDEGFYYLLEVSIIKEVIDVWKEWHDNREQSIDEKIEAILYYAENDAYLPE